MNMDAPSNYAPNVPQSVPKGPRKMGKKIAKTSAGAPQLFTDVSQQRYDQSQGVPPTYYGSPAQQHYYTPSSAPPSNFPGQQYLNDPMAAMAMQYGGTLADQGKQYMQQNIEKYVSASKLKYYFAVDTTYVGKKLGLLLFPYSHTEWSVAFNQDEPVAPRYDVNAPDLYIPVMGFVTFVLVYAMALGLQGRFTPETIGMATSSALGYLVLEILVILFILYILAVKTSLTYMDWAAYCGYKYFGMVLSILTGVLINKLAYYIALLYTGITLSFFMTRALRVQILPHSDDQQTGNKRRLYVLLTLAAIQPVFMWWLTFTLI